MALTSKQKTFLDFIRKYTEKHGCSPTHAETAKHFQFRSRATVTTYLEILEEKGYLRREAHAWQGVEVYGHQDSKVPLLGKVAAGRPIESLKHQEAIEVPPGMLKGGSNARHFALEVLGDSMIGEGILEGDIVVVRSQSTAENGSIVVAEVDGEATIKKFYKRKNQIELHSSNPRYSPILVSSEQNFKISGQFCGLIRMR